MSIISAKTVLFQSSLEEAKRELDFTGELRDRHYEALRSLYEGRDVVCVLSDGYGKSIIYQLLPFMMAKKHGMDRLPVVIIISPLNSTMQDQVIGLRKHGMNAFFLDIEGSGATACQININR